MITAKTGTCTCLPNSVALTYNFLISEWQASVQGSCAASDTFTLQCNSGTGHFILFTSSASVVADLSSTCDPFNQTFTAVTAALACAGSFNVTIIEAP